MIYINKSGRKKGIPIGQSKKELLRIVHLNSGISESDIREKAKNIIKIKDSGTIKTHLASLELAHLITKQSKGKGLENTWYSNIHQILNKTFEKCSLPILTDEQLKAVDFVVKYSNSFLDMLIHKTDWCKIHERLIKSNKSVLINLPNAIRNISKQTGTEINNELLNSFHNINDMVNNIWFFEVIERCLLNDDLLGNINTTSPDFEKEYKDAYKRFTGFDYPPLWFHHFIVNSIKGN